MPAVEQRETPPTLRAMSGRRFAAMLLVSLAGHGLVVALAAWGWSTPEAPPPRPAPTLAIDLVTPDALALAQRDEAEPVPAGDATAPPPAAPASAPGPERAADAVPAVAGSAAPGPATAPAPPPLASASVGAPRAAGIAVTDRAPMTPPARAVTGDRPPRAAAAGAPDRGAAPDAATAAATAPDRAVTRDTPSAPDAPPPAAAGPSERPAAAVAAAPATASAAADPSPASAEQPELARVAPPDADTAAQPKLGRTPADVVLRRLVRDMPCARARLQGDGAGRRVRLQGHVGSPDARARILTAMREAVGASRIDGSALNVVPRPHCDVLSMVADADLRADAPAAGRAAGGVHARFTAGDAVHFDVTAPSFPSYIYVDYFDRAGNVLHLRPYRRAIPERVAPDTTLTIGKGGPFRLRAGAPHGTDLALVVAARTPLFDRARPRREDAAAYLGDLKAALADAQARPAWRGAYTFLLLETVPGPLDAPTN
jgi:hypothetical protein